MTRAPIPLSERGRATRAPQRYIFGPRAEPPTRVAPGRRHYERCEMNTFSNETPPTRPVLGEHDVERWIPGWEGEYSVTRDGSVISHKGGEPRKMTPRVRANGYLRVNLWRRGRGASGHYIHRLVAAAFIGDPAGFDVDHLDRDRANNRLSNLEIVTHAENVRRAPTARGADMGRSPLTDNDIVTIRERRSRGETFVEIAADYPVTRTAIGNICRRTTWRHVA